ncbi:hypothetical protein M9Y10_036995 [Tritrichomonas musculus]|uniref:Protein kinase domain-containing protein n=1 Tax=Tritrichomonas musculus TaxID=1915356 RepID=A0ABR2GSR5_9EUKA
MHNTNFIDINQFQYLDKVGEGAFGEVYRLREKKTGFIYAAKFLFNTIPKEESSKGSIVNFIRNAAAISKLGYPAIANFIGYSPVDFEQEYKPIIITKFVGNITLHDFIQLERKGNLFLRLNDTKKLISIFTIASTMSFLHSLQIIHGNLKPSNILFDKEKNPIITDYGITKITQPKQEKDTVIYSSPEAISDDEYTKEGDVYSFGMIIYNIFSNEPPFKGYSLKDIRDKIRDGTRPEFDFPIPSAYRQLIEKCWVKYPSKRPTFDEITEELRTNAEFITEGISKIEYHNYISFLSKAQLESTYTYAKILYNGDGIPSNKEEAARLFERSAKYGHKNSKLAYAIMLDNGDGIPFDSSKAAILFKEAADNGDERAMYIYSIKLSKGDGVSPNAEESAKYGKMAADCGLAEAISSYSKI